MSALVPQLRNLGSTLGMAGLLLAIPTWALDTGQWGEEHAPDTLCDLMMEHRQLIQLAVLLLERFLNFTAGVVTLPIRQRDGQQSKVALLN